MSLTLSELAARRLRRDVSVEQGEAEYTERRARLVQAVVERGRQRRRVWRWAALAAAFALSAIAGWYVVRADRAASFTAGGSPGRVGAFYAAPADAELALRFGDGSELRLAPGARARVLYSAIGRRALLLESGSAEVDLREQRWWTWEVATGPFLLQAIGAAFRVSWQAETQELSLSVRSGDPRLHGPGVPEGTLASGERRFSARSAPR